jgi:hypothetical protein
MRHVMLTAAITLIAPALLPAQAPRALAMTRDLLIAPENADLSNVTGFAISPRGAILVAQPDDHLIKVFSPSGDPSTIGRKGSGPGEFQMLTQIGFAGDSLWAFDFAQSRIVIFGADFTHTATIPMPRLLAPRNEGTPIGITVMAMLPGGDLRGSLVVRERSVLPSWGTNVTPGATLVVRARPTGVFLARLLEIPESSCRHTYSGGRGGVAMIPFCPERLGTERSNGVGVASIAFEGDRLPEFHYRVSLTNERGGTEFVRDIPFKPIAVGRTSRDSALRLLASNPDARREIEGGAIKPHSTFPPVRRIVLGRDQSVWLEERMTSRGHRWLVLDPKGTTVGTVMLPEDVVLQAAERSTIWATTTDADGLQGIVRYRVGG